MDNGFGFTSRFSGSKRDLPTLAFSYRVRFLKKRE